MAGFMKNAMSYLGMSDVADDDDDFVEEEEEPQKPQPKSSFDSDHTVTPMAQTSTTTPAPASKTTPFQASSRVNRITTIHPKSYEDAQLVGRALRDGVPVVLNLTGVSEAVAYRIVDFSAGVVFGVRGSLERVTPRVFLLSPAQVNIKVEEPTSAASARDLFSD
ncbi:cell division protein SepF [Bifidobacterium sp. LC6]|uniref:Cell division protein SepF n=1 Tax=Bifidobacterium colobi TaxID=2809026 RepID=A0ABS5UVZ7_9BIFI|nr:cell division protein SepF [Bifidobacterium colobi]MBT1174796.1 cell division protein SepF [Bifidobacterium colobi]